MTHTSTEQPEALRLAEYCDNFGRLTPISKELRRLHARVQELEAENKRLHENFAVPRIEDASQDWANCDPAIAFHLIERHADSWADAGKMMQEFADAKSTAAQAQRAPLSEVQRIEVCTTATTDFYAGKYSSIQFAVLDHTQRAHGITQEKQG